MRTAFGSGNHEQAGLILATVGIKRYLFRANTGKQGK
jgi:hypothetical protein